MKALRRGALLALAVIAFLVSGASTAADVAEPIDISDGWLFVKGDDHMWADAVPHGALPIEVNQKWEDQGFDGYDGIGWYFLYLDLPEALQGRRLVLYLGRIDDADQVFLNGKLVGSMGSFPPSPSSAWNTERWYVVEASAWKASNLIAVRVCDMGYGGGMHSGKPMIMTEERYAKMMEDRFKPKNSFHQLPFANGLTSSKLNLDRMAFDSFREHIYSQYDESTKTRDFGREIYFSLSSAPAEIVDPSYFPGTGIVRYSSGADSNSFEAYCFAPMTEDAKKLYYLVKLGARRDGLRFRVGLAISEGDSHSFDANRVVISSGRDFITVKPIGLAGVAWSYRNGFIEIPRLPKDSSMIGISITYSRDAADASPEPAAPQGLLDRELEWWKKWHAAAIEPQFKNERERSVFYQSAAILKMAQVRERGKPFGQILASLPPGHWNICWIRDGSYAVNGLVRAGHLTEARHALTFFLNAEVGKYRTFMQDGRDHGVGVPYGISVCRYFGNGEEESDGGEDPNIELDGFGLFLWALDDYVEASGDHEIVSGNYRRIFREIADVLLHVIEKDTYIVRDESGPWERHLRDNGYNGSKHFSYTSATAYQGLISAARLAEKVGFRDKAQEYTRMAKLLKEGFRRQFCSDGYVKGLSEERDIARAIDAGAVEAINFGMVEAAVARRTLQVFDETIRKKNTVGYARNDDGGDYDKAEWVVIDLRIATAFRKMGEVDRYERLVDWITDQSYLNYGLIGELYSDDSASYEGAIPMCGFGPGAYLGTLFERDGAALK